MEEGRRKGGGGGGGGRGSRRVRKAGRVIGAREEGIGRRRRSESEEGPSHTHVMLSTVPRTSEVDASEVPC